MRITPSEAVLLEGHRHAPRSIVGFPVPGEGLSSETKVATDALYVACATTALLAVEDSGQVRLAPRQEKAFLGLGKRWVLAVEPAGPAKAWPEGSLEALMAGAARPGVDGRGLLSLGMTRSVKPAYQGLARMVGSLAQRGLVEPLPGGLAAFLKAPRAKPVPGTMEALAEARPAADALLAKAKARPDLAAALEAQAKAALSDLTDSD